MYTFLSFVGWNYSKLTEVVVHRIHNGKALNGESDTAKIVLPNGCRNPSYRALAIRNPSRDASNPLINNFDFRVFMFQSMSSGDSIMITSKVIACVEETDCAPVRFRIDDNFLDRQNFFETQTFHLRFLSTYFNLNL